MQDDIGKRYDSFQRAAVATTALLAQLVAVLGAVLLCSVWWHYIVLAFVCIMLTPLWSGMHMSGLEQWWKKHGDQTDLTCFGDDAEQIDQSIEALDNTVTDAPPDRNWPYPPKKK